MRNLARKSSILGLALALSMAISAQPQGNGNGQQKGKTKGQECNYEKGNRGERMVQYLELSPEQKTSIESLKLEHQKKILPLKNELGEKQAKFKTLQSSTPADMKAINSLIDEMGVIKVKMQKERAKMHQEMRKVLTDDQRIKFDMHAGNMRGKGYGTGCGDGQCKRM